ncbi:zinc ribbon domain-containing protein, partial [Streptomyces hyaluromycini]
MSQMPQQAAPAKCPSCAEPLESGDLFCGACGYDLSVVPAAPQDHPTLTMGAAGVGSSGVDWPPPEPESSGTPAAPHLPTDLPGTDSGGKQLPESPHGSPASPPPHGSP